jgi:hypothetical protein
MYIKNDYQNKTLRERILYFGKRTNASIKAPQRYIVKEGDANEVAQSKNARTITFTTHIKKPRYNGVNRW